MNLSPFTAAGLRATLILVISFLNYPPFALSTFAGQSGLFCEATQTLIPEGSEFLITMFFLVCDCYIWPSKLGRRLPRDTPVDTWSEGNTPSLLARTCGLDEPGVVKMGDMVSPSTPLGLLLPPLGSRAMYSIHGRQYLKSVISKLIPQYSFQRSAEYSSLWLLQ